MIANEIPPTTFAYAKSKASLVSLNAKSYVSSVSQLRKYLKYESPDVLLPSGVPLHIISVLAKVLSGSKARIFTRIHTDARFIFGNRRAVSRVLLRLFLWVCSYFSEYHLAASEGAAKSFLSIIPLDPKSVKVLYNPVIDADVAALSNSLVQHPWLGDDGPPVILSIGRLVTSKGFDTLLDSLKITLKKRTVRLIVLGEGNLRQELEERALSLGIKGSVDFYGYVSNPYPFIRKAQMFVFASRYEGFGNVIAEALFFGCPVVTTDAPSGPREILRGGDYGTLVPVDDPVALSDAVVATLDGGHEKESLSSRGASFHVETVTDQLEELLVGARN